MPALEMTTTDIMHGLGENGGSLPRTLDGFRNFLHRCDMVKFAKHRPELPDSGAILTLARRLVRDTIPSIGPRALRPTPLTTSEIPPEEQAEPENGDSQEGGHLMFRFEDPLVFGLLLLLPVLILVHDGGEPAAGPPSVSQPWRPPGAPGRDASRWVARVPGILRFLALAAMIMALARPQTGITSESVLTQGIDIVLAMDVSSSMLAEDLEPNRLEAAKEVAAEFVQGTTKRPDRPGGLCRRSLHPGSPDAGLRGDRRASWESWTWG